MNREIPHNIDAEESVLGAMFLTKKALQKALELLDGSEFYLDKHAKIFECIKTIDARGGVVDLTTVADELNNKNWLKQVGDIEYLTELVETVPSASGVTEALYDRPYSCESTSSYRRTFRFLHMRDKHKSDMLSRLCWQAVG